MIISCSSRANSNNLSWNQAAKPNSEGEGSNMYKQSAGPKITKQKAVGADETRKRLEILYLKSFDPAALDDVTLDRRETARFIAEKLRILRLAAGAGGLRTLTWMIENSFYEAYGLAQSKKSDSIEFVSSLAELQQVFADCGQEPRR
jgi:hypothetical protein